jgi:hypothetical protein
MIGENRLRQIIDIDKCEKRLDWILRVGQWTRIKREPFEKWVLSQSDL